MASYHGLGLKNDSSSMTSHHIGLFLDILNNDVSFRMRVNSMSKIFKKAEELRKSIKTMGKVLNQEFGQSLPEMTTVTGMKIWSIF